jgi:hypothetical protein
MYKTTNNYNNYVEVNSGLSSDISSGLNMFFIKDYIRSFKTANYTLQDRVTMEPTERTIIIINNTLQPSLHPTYTNNSMTTKSSVTTNNSMSAIVISISIIVPILSLFFCYKLYKMMHKKVKTNEEIEIGIDINNIV